MIDGIRSALHLPEGSLWSQDHWRQVSYSKEEQEVLYEGLLDTSTGYVYRDDLDSNPWILRYKAAILIAMSPLYWLGSAVYYIARPIICAIGHQLGKIEDFSWKGELKLSGRQLLEGPAFLTGMVLGALYMLYDPYNGQKIVNHYEFLWNDKKWVITWNKTCLGVYIQPLDNFYAKQKDPKIGRLIENLMNGRAVYLEIVGDIHGGK